MADFGELSRTDITKGVRAFTIGTAISRVLGLVRESVFAYLYGAGLSTDAFNAAFRIPNLLRDLFAETALSAAFVPVLTEEREKNKRQENLAASNVFNILFLVVAIVVVLGIVFAPQITNILAFGFGKIPNKLGLTTSLTVVMFPFLLFVALAAWAMSYLNTEREFFVPSLAPALFNVFSIVIPISLFAFFTKQGYDPIYGMAIGVTAGGLMQFLIQVPRLYKKGFRYEFYINFKDPSFKKMMVLFVPVAIGLAGTRINVAISTVLISLLEERSMTWLNYAFRIMHLPLGLFGIAVGTVALPTLSKLVVEKNLPEIRRTLFDSLKLVFFLTIPTSIIIAFLAIPITRIIYERGRFTSFDTLATAQALILYIIGIPFIAGLRNIAAVFYAHKDAKAPLYASFVSIIINIVLNLALMHLFGFRAFPLSTTIAAFVNIVLLLLWLPKKIGAFEVVPLVRYFVLLAIASFLGGLCGWLVLNFLSQILSGTLLNQIITLLVAGSIALIVFYLVGSNLMSEVRQYLVRLVKR